MKWINIFRNKLAVKLSVLVLCISLFLLLAFVFTNQYAAKKVRQNTLELNRKLLAQVENQLEDFFDNLYNVAASFSYSPTTSQYLTQDTMSRVQSMEDLSTVFSNTLLLEDDIQGIYLYNQEMDRIASLGKALHIPGLSGQLVEDLQIGAGFKAEDTGHLYYSVRFPMFDLDSPQYAKQLGMCVLVISPDSLGRLLTDARSTDHSQVYLVDQNNLILASTDLAPPQTLNTEMLKSTKDYCVQIQDSASSSWRLVSRLPEGELNRQDAGSWIVLLPYTASFLLLLVLICFFYFSVVRPIRLIDVFIKTDMAYPGQRISLMRSDEIGTVATSLNHMLDVREQMEEENRLSQKKMYESELAKKQAQVLAYRNQINPHFLYNTLECIRDMALYYDVEDIAEITMSLSHLFRYAVKGGNITTIAEEMDYIEKYAKIIEYRFMGKISVDIELEESLRQVNVIKLLLQPLVENAVFHGLEQKVSEGLVEICACWDSTDHIRFTIEDNGCGIPAKKLNSLLMSLKQGTDQSGVGIANIYHRLTLFYGDRFNFEIESTPDVGTRVTIVIPCSVEEGGTEDAQSISG
ncbi:MAG: sensor histidine kinase [Lachnospiraceae bacterium]|jgi:two-component system sensor histidine kinase YesM|nr:sensor histidine kinase [Lachnospiraceae bacterium]